MIYEQIRDQLQPLDFLMYGPDGSLLSKLLQWGEWSNTPQEVLQWVHVGFVVDPKAGTGFEMNPPAAHYTDLPSENWDRIDAVLRLTVPVDRGHLQAFVDANNGVPYPYTRIGQFLAAGLLSRVGLPTLGRGLLAAFPSSSAHDAVCSATACLAASCATAQGLALWPKSPDDMRPADIGFGKYVKKVVFS